MPYRLTSSDQHKLIFEREGAGFAPYLFIIIGSVFLLVGIVINLFSTDFEFPFLLFRILLPLFGAGAIAAGFSVPKQNRLNPEVITFDHSKAVVIVEMTRNGFEKGHIRYDEIEKFATYTERQSSSSNNSSSSYYYHVFLRKKDGGEWFLTRSGTKQKADEILSKITASVQTDKASSVVPTAKLTDKIIREEKMDKTLIHWENKVGIAGPLFLLLFGAVFLSILGAATTAVGGLGMFGNSILGFMFVIFCIVMFFSVKTMVKNATTRFAISIGKTALEYLEIRKSSGASKVLKTIPLPEVYGVSYSFSPVRNYSGGLSIMTRENLLQSQHEKDHPLEALKNIFSAKKKPIILSIAGLTPVECLQLESWLQELIKKKGGSAI